jgi:hypothetical protein
VKALWHSRIGDAHAWRFLGYLGHNRHYEGMGKFQNYFHSCVLWSSGLGACLSCGTLVVRVRVVTISPALCMNMVWMLGKSRKRRKR